MWWDTQDRKLLRTVDAHYLWVRHLTVNAAQNLMATVSDDMTCKLWDARSGRLAKQLTGFDARLPRYDYPNKLFSCAFSPDGRHVTAADEACRMNAAHDHQNTRTKSISWIPEIAPKTIIHLLEFTVFYAELAAHSPAYVRTQGLRSSGEEEEHREREEQENLRDGARYKSKAAPLAATKPSSIATSGKCFAPALRAIKLDPLF